MTDKMSDNMVNAVTDEVTKMITGIADEIKKSMGKTPIGKVRST
jgi:hypothetical protein